MADKLTFDLRTRLPVAALCAIYAIPAKSGSFPIHFGEAEDQLSEVIQNLVSGEMLARTFEVSNIAGKTVGGEFYYTTQEARNWMEIKLLV